MEINPSREINSNEQSLTNISNEFYKEQASFYQKNGDLEQAIFCYEQLTKLQYDDWEHYSALSNIFLELERWDDVVEVCEKTATINPNIEIVWRNLSIAFSKMERWKDVERCKTKLSQLRIFGPLKNEVTQNSITEDESRIGRIDHVGKELIRGWALPEGNIDFSKLDVFIDQIFFTQINANILRQDLLKHGLGNGRNGFEFAIPDFLALSELRQIDIKFSDTLRSLKKSPVEFITDKHLTDSYNYNLLIKKDQIYRNLKRSKSTSTVVIVPIFNAYDETRNCIQSLIKWTSSKALLLLINDCSSDQRIEGLLEWASSYSNIQIIQNPENLGYTSTINKGIDIAKDYNSDSDIILLNSDTQVGPQWLQNLRRAAYYSADIGTVTAISNNAGAFSVPDIGKYNNTPNWLTNVGMSRAVNQLSKKIYAEIPTGNGFCLYIRRDTIDNIGNFDATQFPRGYGEENDFCMRALRGGWRHILDDSTLVYHVRSASFKGEKTQLLAAGRKNVDTQYPEYKHLTSIFQDSQELQFIRYNIRYFIEKAGAIKKPPLPRVLYVVSTRTGGTPQTNADLMKGIENQYHPFLLVCDGKTINLYDASVHPHKHYESISLKEAISIVTHCSSEYDDIVSSILIQYSIELVHIRHISWHSLNLPKIAKVLDIPVIFSFHDFYTICPTVNLLDENQRFCAGQCTDTPGDCQVHLWSSVPTLKHQFIRVWRRMMTEMLGFVDAFVTTSSSTKQQLQMIYPFLKSSIFPVIPHGRNFQELTQKISPIEKQMTDDAPLKILFPGNIGDHKGAKIIREISKLDRNKSLEIHFLGRTNSSLRSIGHHHGTYQREDFFDRIRKIQPHYVGIFSIWPETYCHTLTEAWASGVPVIALDQGAVGERMHQHNAGWLIDSLDPYTIYQELLKIARDKLGYLKALDAVKTWQQSYGLQNTIERMAIHYCQLYQEVLDNAKVFRLNEDTSQRQKCIGIFIKRDKYSQSPPSAHIRVLDWFQHPLVSEHLIPQFLEVEAFLEDCHKMIDIDMVLVQRNIIPPHLVDLFITTCKERQLPIIFELDDDLFNVPLDKDRDGSYFKAVGAIEKIAQSAASIVTSTEVLAKKIRKYYNKNVTVIPNALSEFLWFRPIEQVYYSHSDTLLENDDAIFKVLYMGNSSHGEDLAIIKPVFEQFSHEGKPIKLFVIGGESAGSSKEDWYHRVKIPQDNYPEFIAWFQSISHLFDIAIAPLSDTPFNNSKSVLKYIQYSAIGLPAIYSNCLPYNQVVIHNRTGFLAKNTKQDWKESLLYSLDLGCDLKKIAEAAKQDILSKHLMSQHIEEYLCIFEDTYTRSSNQKI